MRHFSSALIVVAIASWGCSDPVGLESDVLRVRKAPTALELTNVSTAPVYYFAADRGWLALVDWAVCDDPATCVGIAPSTSKQLAWEDIGGYSATTSEVVVYHWRLVPGSRPSGFVADSIRSLVVRIR